MQIDWLELNGARYYLESKVGSSTGVMVTGTRDINGKTYIFGDDGICLNY
jgi:glucan-binding YG repeat protein